MSFLKVLVIVAQILSALGVISLVLLQHGKGADMGAAFGSGTSGSLFGATGSANFLSRTAAVLAVIFFIATLALAYLGSYKSASSIGLLTTATAPASTATGSQAAGASVPSVSSLPVASSSVQDVPK
ncbi:MAG: preprotein translocase subunit SecG [Burkholderia sp.]|nr:MAG: Protein-export membrane protein SecG [Burkholderia gladioli]